MLRLLMIQIIIWMLKKIGKEGDNLALEVKIVPGTNIGRTILGNNFISYILVFYPIRFEM